MLQSRESTFSILDSSMDTIPDNQLETTIPAAGDMFAYLNLQNTFTTKDKTILTKGVENPSNINEVFDHFRIPKTIITILPEKDYVHRILKFIYSVCLEAHTYLPKNLYLLKTGLSQIVSLSRKECCCLLCMAFCNKLGDFNFNYWLQREQNKLLGLLNYFDVLHQINDNRIWNDIVNFLRKHNTSYNLHQTSYNTPIKTKLHLLNINDRLINTVFTLPSDENDEDNNAVIGNNVLGNDTSENAMQYIIHPECLIALFLCEHEPLNENEAIGIINVLNFSVYTRTVISYKIGGAVNNIRRETAMNIIIYNEITEANCYSEDSIKKHINKIGAVFEIIDETKARSWTHPVIITGLGANNGPCIYDLFVICYMVCFSM